MRTNNKSASTRHVVALHSMPVLAGGLAADLRDALDPSKASGKCRSLKDMSPEERASIIAQYTRH